MVSQNKPEDYQTSLSEEQKNILDDAPAKVVAHLFDYVERNGQMEFFNLKVRDKLTGIETFAAFRGPDSVNGIDYLRYLVRNGYKDLADAG